MPMFPKSWLRQRVSTTEFSLSKYFPCHILMWRFWTQIQGMGFAFLKKTLVTLVVLSSIWTHGEIWPTSLVWFDLGSIREFVAVSHVWTRHRNSTGVEWMKNKSAFFLWVILKKRLNWSNMLNRFLIKTHSFHLSKEMFVSVKLLLEFLLLHHYFLWSWLQLVLFHAFKLYLCDSILFYLCFISFNHLMSWPELYIRWYHYMWPSHTQCCAWVN